MACWTVRDHLELYLRAIRMSWFVFFFIKKSMRVRGGGDKLVVGVLGGDFFEVADDSGLFLDGGLDLAYERGVYFDVSPGMKDEDR